MGKLGIELQIWLVAACRYVEIMHSDRITQTRLIGKRHRDMTGIRLAAEAPAIGRRERQARDDRDAVIALLTIHRDVRIAEPLQPPERELSVRTFRFLQAQNVRTDAFEKSRDQIDA